MGMMGYTMTKRHCACGMLCAFLVALCFALAAPQEALASYATVTDEYPAAQDLGSYGDIIYPSDIPDGTYSVNARTTSRMCILYENNGDAEASVNKERCFIQVRGGQMIAAFYISRAYTRLYMGTAEEAASLTNADGTDDSAYLVGEPADGYVPHRFVIAIPALNYPIIISTFAGGNYPLESPQAKWLTRQVVFSPGPDLLQAIENAKQAAQVDTSALENALVAAQNDYASYPVSVDGSDISPDMQWVPQQAKEAFANVIMAAQAVARDSSSTQDQVNAATSSLQAAQAAFGKSKAAGTYVDVPKSDQAAEPEPEKQQPADDKTVATATSVTGDTASDNGSGGGNGSAPAGAGAQEEPEQQTAQPAQEAQEQQTGASSVQHGVLLSPTSLVDRLEDGEGEGEAAADDEAGSQGLTIEQAIALGFAGLVIVGIATRAIVFNRSRRQRASA